MRRLMLPAAVIAVLVTTGCSSDVTRPRIESDVAQSFAGAYALSDTVAGLTPTRPDVVSTSCTSTVDKASDHGAGLWSCTVSYRLGGRLARVVLAVTVDPSGCYRAVDGVHHDRTITSAASGRTVPDPRVGFDGCFDVTGG